MKFFMGIVAGTLLTISTAAIGYYSSYTDVVELDVSDLEDIIEDAVVEALKSSSGKRALERILEDKLEDCEVRSSGDIYCR